jgi:hypothetical protein
VIECRVWRGEVQPTPPASIELEVMLRESTDWARFDFYRDGVLVLALDAAKAREVAHAILAAKPVEKTAKPPEKKRAKRGGA